MPKRHPHRQRGAVLLWVVGIVTVLLLMVGVITKSLVAAHHEQRTHLRQVQADFLVESGLERAAAMLARKPGYSGEVWDLPAENGLDVPATITITVATVADQPRERLVTTTASYGQNTAHRALATRQVTLAVPAPQE